jgi:putative membrane protein
MNKFVTTVLWILLAAYAVTTILPALNYPIPHDAAISVTSAFLFALIHGAVRYRVRGILVFVVVCLVVSNITENLSILTGFPFGHYYYTDKLGTKLFLVPLLIGPGYFGTGYLAWTLANVLLDAADRRKNILTVIGMPVIAAFIMVGWDVTMDPANSTFDKNWIWLNGGGYFGVPLVNYLGWYLTVWIFYQLFALYLMRSPDPIRDEQPKAYWYQAAWFFLVIAISFPAIYLAGSNAVIKDATGKVWQTGDIFETAAIISIFTMVFVAVLSFFKIAQSDETTLS